MASAFSPACWGPLLLAGGGTAIALKLAHDSDVRERRERQARLAAEARERERQREREAAEEARREEEAQEAPDEIERDSRRELEKSLRKSITKDAREKVAAGLLEGPILRTVCDPVGGGRDDLEARTGEYECIAVTDVGARPPDARCATR